MLALAQLADNKPPSMVQAYLDGLASAWPRMVAALALVLAAMVLWNVLARRVGKRVPGGFGRGAALAVVAAMVGVGLWRAFDRATCFDDAYISLRYARNLVEGHGLVWNVGERVEGYTNFLWTMLVAAVMWLTSWEPPLVAVVLSALAFAANLVIVWRIGRVIAPPSMPGAFSFPVAVALLAVQNTFTDYGTTGLETALCSLLVNLGILALVSRDGARSALCAGLCWILATLARPDHAIFYAIGSAVMLGIWARPSWTARRDGFAAIWRAGLRPMVWYAAPFTIWLAHAAWKLAYYGHLLPNTYHAKAANLSYYEQGFVYAGAFFLASHLWLVLAVVVVAWVRHPLKVRPARRFASFAIPSFLLYLLYVVRVGGDFMYGRFFVSLIPLLALAAQQALHQLVSAGRQEDLATPVSPHLSRGAILAACVVALSAGGVRLIPPRRIWWHLADEPTFYRITEWSPVVIDHPNYRVGVALGGLRDKLEERGVASPAISSGAIGLLGYYSRMPVIDRRGLTDASVARKPLTRRSRPGHEKAASPTYLRDRGVRFVRSVPRPPDWFRTCARIVWKRGTGGRPWWILTYDRELMRAIREVDSSVQFRDAERCIDSFVRRMSGHSADDIRERLRFFDTYYFDHNDDPKRRERLVKGLERAEEAGRQ